MLSCQLKVLGHQFSLLFLLMCSRRCHALRLFASIAVLMTIVRLRLLGLGCLVRWLADTPIS